MTLPQTPIDPAAVIAALDEPFRWQVAHTLRTGSTNADLAVAADKHRKSGAILIAEEQVAGRGRLGRTWTAPAGSSLILSVLVRPDAVPVAARGWIGGLVGVAVVDAIGAVAGLTARLKWPNDVLIDGRKCAGILAELADGAVVVGTGINVTVRTEELPLSAGATPPTSLQQSGASGAGLDRAKLAAAILNRLGPLLDSWQAAVGDVQVSGLLAAYRDRCATIGSPVTVQLPGGRGLIGVATGIDASGRLLVRTADGQEHAFTAADVQHVRTPAGQGSR